MRTSFSALETYKLCPQKYKFQEIDRLPAKKSKAAIFGTHLHSTLKYMFWRDPLFPTLDQVLSYFRENFSALAGTGEGRNATGPETFTPEEIQLYLASGQRMLKNFYAKNAPWNFSVVDLESRFEVLIEDRARGQTHILAGRIDRIDKTEDGYEIIDYKTSRRMPSQEEVDRDRQMSIYSLGLQKRWPHLKPENIKLSLHFLKHGEKLSTKRSVEDTEKTISQILKTAAEIQNKLSSGQRFEPAPGTHCDWCAYKPICPAWRHLYKKQESGIKNQEDIDAALKEYFEILKKQRQDQARLAELKSKIASYMESEGFDRVFSDDGHLTRSRQKRFAYDFEKIRNILEPIGKWEEILVADDKKLKIILKSLPLTVQTQIEEAKIVTGEFSLITASTKKISPPPAS